ncbi:MAG: phosphoribosylamine--glycine ligase [Deltaproteobacteria bacterium]|nr:phosphoribosylamine--glycine ligase [Deltaproteobacteria bacterium]
MKILVVGGGGREHAVAWALRRHGHAVLCAPGNPGIGRVAERLPVAAEDIDGQVQLAVEKKVDLVVVGPEAPLVLGLADALADRGVPCFGPTRKGAQLEGSKSFSKEFFARHGIPSAEFFSCRSMDEVERALAHLGDSVVVKADGLAAGKGVVVCSSAREARAAARRMLVERELGAAGERVVVEQRLMGREASILALTDGERIAVLPPAEDHKAVFDGDLGPNTGGMGVVSPTNAVSAAILDRVRAEVLLPTVRGLASEGIVYRGVLYAGLMITSDGTPLVLEYNCRLGDPEAEPLFMRWEDDPAPWLLGAATGNLPGGEPCFSPRTAACVIMAAEGYPASPRSGDEIEGIREAESLSDVVVFHSGTRQMGDRLVTAGGRVLAVTALGDDVDAARARAYEAAAMIRWRGVHYRRDIGLRDRR